MPTINKHNLRRLRHERHWTLDALAEHSGVNRGTINRIETGRRVDCRRVTVQRLAAALKTDMETLLGEDLPSSTRVEEISSKSQMNIRMANDARNAFSLVSLRYGVKASHIMHLAPLLFLWAAEESLRRRRDKLEAVADQLDAIDKQSSFKHLNGNITKNWRGEEVMDEERRSIAKRDIFGLLIDGEALKPNYEESEHNPMAQFLRELCDSLNGLAEFEYWSPYWDRPGYTLGRDEALQLAGGDEDAAGHVIDGNVGLHDLPKDVREEGACAVATWLKEKGNARREQIERMMLDIEL